MAVTIEATTIGADQVILLDEEKITLLPAPQPSAHARRRPARADARRHRTATAPEVTAAEPRRDLAGPGDAGPRPRDRRPTRRRDACRTGGRAARRLTQPSVGWP